MQKKLIALAVAGLVSSSAFAQSNVTISGTIRAGVEQHKRSDLSKEVRVTDQSSEIAFSGNEDLGNGLKAWFRLATRFSIDEGNGTATRNVGISGQALGNSGIGLEGSFGKITLGRWDLHYNQPAGIENSKVFSLQGLVGHGVMSQVAGRTIARGTRSDNVLMYDTPNMSGFVGTIAWSALPGGQEGNCALAAAACPTTSPSKNGAWNLRAAYANGPITGAYSYWSWKNEGGLSAAAAAAGVQDERGDTLVGRYAFSNGFKVGLGWNKSRVTNNLTAGNTNISRTAWMLPIAYETGKHNITFTYAKAGNASGSVAAAVAGTAGTGGSTGAKVFKLGYDYSVSKRTAFGVHYIKLNNDSMGNYNLFNTGAASVSGSSANTSNATTNTAGVTGMDQTQWYAGVNHNF